MGWTCGYDGGTEEMRTKFWWRNNLRNVHLKDTERDLREKSCEDGRSMEVAQDRVQWRAFVLAAVLNLRFLLPQSFSLVLVFICSIFKSLVNGYDPE
jgi:hypothetical protein